MRSPHPGDSLERPGFGARASRLMPLVAEIVPPAYSGERVAIVDEPAELRALEGSHLTFRGRGDGSGVFARVGTDSVAASRTGDRWSIDIPVARGPMAIRLEERENHRIVTV